MSQKTIRASADLPPAAMQERLATEPIADAGAKPPRPLLSKRGAWLFSIGLSLAVSFPVIENFRDQPKDSFPLSYFPMFSFKRAETYQVHYAVAVSSQGQRRRVPFYDMAVSGGFNQVRRQVRRSIQEGFAQEYCRGAAARLATLGGKYADVEMLDIVEGDFHIERFMAGEREPLSEKVHASCAVERSMR